MKASANKLLLRYLEGVGLFFVQTTHKDNKRDSYTRYQVQEVRGFLGCHHVLDFFRNFFLGIYLRRRFLSKSCEFNGPQKTCIKRT